MPLKIVVLSTTEQRDGIADYTRQLFRPEFQLANDAKVTVLRIALGNMLKTPFLRPGVIHMQHEFFMFDRLVGLSAIFYYPYLWLWSRILGIKIVSTIHSAYDIGDLAAQLPHFKKFRPIFPLLAFYMRLHYWMVLKLSDRTIFLTKAGVDNMRSIVSDRFVERRLRHIPLGNYTPNIHPKKHGRLASKFNLSTQDRLFTLFGFAFPTKGYEYGIMALDILVNQRGRRDIRLFIVSGETGKRSAPGGGQGGTYLDFLRQLARERKVQDYVIFTGYLADNDPLLEELFAETSCFIFPYLNRAFASAAISTALTSGKAVLVSKIKCFEDFDDLPSFPEKDAAALADKMEQLASDPAKLGEAVKIAQHNATRFSMDRIFARHIGVYKEALGS